MPSAAGLVIAGVLALVLGWVFSDFAMPTPDPWWTRALTVVVVLAVAGSWWERRLILVAAAVALAVTVLAVLGFVDQFSRGFPGRATVLTAVGGLAVAVGMLLVRRSEGSWVRAVLAFLVVPVVVVPLVLVVPDARVSATTADRAEPAAVPKSVSGIAWDTEVDGQVKQVVAAGTGVVVLLSAGVVALDGRTGDVRWRRARHGAAAVQVDASPDGKTVLVQYRPAGLFPIRREIIDAFTGEVRYTVDTEGSFRAYLSPMTDSSYIGANDDESEFYGYSLADGHRLWTYRAPADCWIKTDTSTHVAVGSGLLLPVLCGKDNDFTEVRYVSVDATTGKVGWQHVIRLPEASRDVEVTAHVAPDRQYLAVQTSIDDFTTPSTTTTVLDTETGADAALPASLEPRAGGLATTDDLGLLDMATGAVTATSRAVLSCVRRNFGVSLSSGAVCVAPALDSFAGFFDSGRIDLAAAAYDNAPLITVPVTLGPRLEPFGDTDEIIFVAAPGAVVVTTGLAPADGGRIHLVGLR